MQTLPSDVQADDRSGWQKKEHFPLKWSGGGGSIQSWDFKEYQGHILHITIA